MPHFIRRNRILIEAKKKGWNAQDVADRLGNGTNARVVKSWFYQARTPNDENLFRLCILFKKKPEDLIFIVSKY